MKKTEVFIKLSEQQKPESIFPASDCFIAKTDGKTVPDKNSLMKELASVFRFPGYFGENWDALLDCLRSLPDELEADNFILAVKDYPSFLNSSSEDKKTFEEIFAEAAVFIEEAYKKKLVLAEY